MVPSTATTEARPIPGVYVWEPAGKPISIRLSLDVVDRMQQDVMRGFGAVPKRGAEVGGILLGRWAPGEKRVVAIDDYVMVPIEYKRGPSYLLSEEDAQAFETAVQHARGSEDPLLHPVGYFRSHTRDGVGLGPEDLAIFNLHFPEPEAVALVIRPYATKVSQAGFYFQEGGSFQAGMPLLEFPFRRRDLDPESPAPTRPVRPMDRPVDRPAERPSLKTFPRGKPEQRPLGFDAADQTWAAATHEAAARTSDPEAALAAALMLDAKTKNRGGWIWVPLSFIFLLLGVLLGFQAAQSMRPQLPLGSNAPYNLNLSVTKSGNNLQVKWNRQALAVRTAQKGLLTIADGAYNKPVPLNSFDLQSGSVVYPPYSNHVTFRLDVIVNARDTLTETVDWQQ